MTAYYYISYIMSAVKITDLKLGDKATLKSTKVKGYVFSGIVKLSDDGRLWLTSNDKDGYILNEKFADLWEITKE